MLLRIMTISLVALGPMAAMAQERANGIEFRFGLGPSIEPGYFGDEDMDTGIGSEFQIERFRLGGISLGGAEVDGLGFGGSVRVVGARNADDFDELAGLEDIDTSVEIGGGLEYTAPTYDMFAKLRYGVIGHQSFVVELGGDVLYQPTDQLTLKAGPRVLFGDDDFAQTYFGVSPAASAASSFDTFYARGGIISAGAKAEAIYAINNDWEVIGTLEYEQLRDDAADSPITRSDDQLSGSIVLTRRITFGF